MLPAFTSSIICAYCNNTHATFHCREFKALSATDRLRVINQLERCHNCLGNHSLSHCRSTQKCHTCGGSHHTLLHRALSETVPDRKSSTSAPRDSPRSDTHVSQSAFHRYSAQRPRGSGQNNRSSPSITAYHSSPHSSPHNSPPSSPVPCHSTDRSDFDTNHAGFSDGPPRQSPPAVLYRNAGEERLYYPQRAPSETLSYPLSSSYRSPLQSVSSAQNQ